MRLNWNGLVVEVSVLMRDKSDQSGIAGALLARQKHLWRVCFSDLRSLYPVFKALTAIFGSLSPYPLVLFTEVIQISLQGSDYVFRTFIAFMVLSKTPRTDSFALEGNWIIVSNAGIKCDFASCWRTLKTPDSIICCHEPLSMRLKRPWVLYSAFRPARLITGNLWNVYALPLFWFVNCQC